jgi:crotonobetainyl-CoA:carnitine CoA-transferase CaiB-like acyl-CoA transferase
MDSVFVAVTDVSTGRFSAAVVVAAVTDVITGRFSAIVVVAALIDDITGRFSAVVVVATVDMVVVESSICVKIIAVGIAMADKNKIAVTQEKIMHINFLVGIDKQL